MSLCHPYNFMWLLFITIVFIMYAQEGDYLYHVTEIDS